MRSIIVILVFLIAFPFIMEAQTSFQGYVFDIDTKTPLSCVEVEIMGSEKDIRAYSNSEGLFVFNDLPEGDYYISTDFSDYMYYEDDVYVETGIDDYNIELYLIDSPISRIEDIADEDILDLGTCISFYSPSIANFNNDFKSDFSIEMYNIEARFKLANRLQLGFKTMPIALRWTSFSNPDAGFTKQRYFSASAGLFIYTRIIPTVLPNSGKRGMFIDLGAGYILPYYFAESKFTSKYNRETGRHFHNYKDFEAMFRLGFTWLAVKATYRFTDILNAGYTQPPRLQFGIEFLLPMD